MYQLMTALAAAPVLFAQSGIQDGSFVNPTSWTVTGGAIVLPTSPGFSSLGYIRMPAGSTAAAKPGGILAQGRNVVSFMLRASPGATGSVTMDTNWTLGGSALQFSADNQQSNGSVLPGWRPKVLTGVTPGGKGVVSTFGITSNDGAELDDLLMFYVKPRNTSIGRFGGGSLTPNTIGYGAALYAMWETSLSSPTTVANGAVVLAGYAPSAAPSTMKLVFQAKGDKYPATAPGALQPAVLVEFYNWTAKRWQAAVPYNPMSTALSQTIPISSGALAQVTVPVGQPARFIDPAQENLMVVRIRPTIDARKCIGRINSPPPCAPVAASFMTVFVQ